MERLDEIKERPLKMMTLGLKDYDVVTECIFDYRDLLWLIEQAEENAKLREALEYYADEDFEDDGGDIAKSALEETK